MPFQEYNCKLVSPGQRLSNDPIETLLDAVVFLGGQIHDECVEHIYAILCAPDTKPVGFILLGKGEETICCCSPAELIRACVLTNATSVCILHNHPCTEFTAPSPLDDAVAVQFKNALETLNIRLMDFVIVNQMQELYSYLCVNRAPFEETLTEEALEYEKQMQEYPACQNNKETILT